MINWEEIKHMHVIRKFELLLAQWFDTEVFLLDERGKPRNYDPTDRQREFKNPLCANLLPKDTGREMLMKFMSETHESCASQEESHIIVEGPTGIEKAVIAPIMYDGDFLGSVFAYSFIEKKVSSDQKSKAAKKIEKLEMDPDLFKNAVERLKVLDSQETKYLTQLVELVAQEIVSWQIEIAKREDRIHALSNQLETRHRYDQMIGKSKPMQGLYSMLDKIKGSEATVLIQGENGTGKELIARAVHYNSPRKDGQFVTVNCSAFNDNLLESELFGHNKGSFTGAVRDKMGLFEAADKGTLFLDEIGDMTPAMQVKLLRVLQEGTFTPVGGTDTKKVDVRVLAATNQDLKEMVEIGTFREDLYYRVNVINIVVPPLRDRKEDIPLLLDHFIISGCKDKGVEMKTFAKRAIEKIFDYPWPGNVRELQNEVERLIVLSGREPRISVDMLSQRIRDFGAGKAQGVRISGKLKDALEELEKTMIKEGLRRTKWNKSRLAKELGISRAGLIMKVEKYGLDKRKVPVAKDPKSGKVA